MRVSKTLAAVSMLCFGVTTALSAEPPGTGLAMSPGLRELFRAEMRELLAGTQAIAMSLPAANWDGMATSALAMRDSYVLDKKLTKAQAHELEQLPADFRSLDQAFHVRAEKLAHAAKARDAEAVSFQFSRLLDTCVACHSSYARVQFPNFESKPDAPHHH